MNIRPNTLNLILAATLALPFAAQAQTTVSADGWLQVGSETLLHVGPPAGHAGKTRAEVRGELAAQQRNPVGTDGWLQDGEVLRFVGAPAATQGKSRAEVRAELAAHLAGNGVSHDGWQQLGGETLIYVGTAAPTTFARHEAAPARASSSPQSAHGQLRELVSASLPAAAAAAANTGGTSLAAMPKDVGGFDSKRFGELVFGARS